MKIVSLPGIEPDRFELPFRKLADSDFPYDAHVSNIVLELFEALRADPMPVTLYASNLRRATLLLMFSAPNGGSVVIETAVDVWTDWVGLHGLRNSLASNEKQLAQSET